MIKNPNKYRLLRVFEYMLQTDECYADTEQAC